MAAPVHQLQPDAPRLTEVPWVCPAGLHEVLAGHDAGLGVVLGWVADAATSIWIGRRVWPAAVTLHRAGRLDGALFVKAERPRDRAWAAELCAACAALDAVIVDGGGFDLTMTRRLALATRGTGRRLILLRPDHERRQPSAAGTRWHLVPVPVLTPDAADVLPRRPRWSVALIRRKGGHRTPHAMPADLEAMRAASARFCHDVPGPDDEFPAHLHAEWDPHAGRATAVPGVPRAAPADLAGRPTPTQVATA